MIFDQYDWIRVINLPQRTDRRREMIREFQKFGLDNRSQAAFFPAIRTTDRGMFHCVGANGAFHSHLKVLEEALAVRASVIVLEDDCTFLSACANTVAAQDTDVLYGGYALASDENDLMNADIEGAHFMGFSVRALEKLVPFLQSILDPQARFDPDIVRSNFDPKIRPPIDGAYVWFRRYYPEMKTEFLPLASYRLSATDVGAKRWFDKVPIVRGVANEARRVKERLFQI